MVAEQAGVVRKSAAYEAKPSFHALNKTDTTTAGLDIARNIPSKVYNKRENAMTALLNQRTYLKYYCRKAGKEYSQV